MTNRQLSLCYETLELPQLDPSINYNNWDNKIPTPVDELGLVQDEELVKLVKATIDPEYKWSGKPDVHHYYWHAAWYPYTLGGPGNPGLFRDLPIHKGLVYRELHQWIEKVTIPPPVPDPEIMWYRNEAWEAYRNLFKAGRLIIQTDRLTQREIAARTNPELAEVLDSDPDRVEKIMFKQFERSYRGIERHLKKSQDIPPELQLVDTNKPLEDIVTSLGRLMMKSSRNFLPELRAA